MVSQVFQVFSMTSLEKDSAKMLQIFLLAPQMFDVHWQNFWVKKKWPTFRTFFFGQAIKYVYVRVFQKVKITNTFIHIFASGLSWHSLSERWWSYVVQMLSPLKSKFQEKFLFDAESVISSIRSYLMSHLHQCYIRSRFKKNLFFHKVHLIQLPKRQGHYFSQYSELSAKCIPEPGSINTIYLFFKSLRQQRIVTIVDQLL